MLFKVGSVQGGFDFLCAGAVRFLNLLGAVTKSEKKKNLFCLIRLSSLYYSRLDQYKVGLICCAQAQFVFKIPWCSNRKKRKKEEQIQYRLIRLGSVCFQGRISTG